MPRPPNKAKGGIRGWFLDEWRKILTALAIAFLLFAIPLAFAPVRNLIWPPAAPGYPVVCTAEPVWQGGDKRLVEIYFINTAREELTGEQLAEKLRAALGERAQGASTAVLFPYQQGEPRAESAAADERFNDGKGELLVQLTGKGVRVQPRRMAALAVLRANVIFPVEDDSVEFSRGAKITAGMVDLAGPESGCFTRP